MITPLAPAGGGGLAELQALAAAEGVTQGGQADPLTRRLAEQLGQKAGAFKPPVAEQLGVKGGHQ